MLSLETAFLTRPALMPYFPLGYPDLDISIAVIEALANNGADLIEVGLSFSDPLADGPVIQKATQVALKNGITIAASLQAVWELRRRGVEIPLLLMGYYNPLLSYGLARFADQASEMGVNGFIIPDLPPEESGEFESAAGSQTLIRMIAPTTPLPRMKMIAEQARGFIYLVSVAGVTGARSELPAGLVELVGTVRQFSSVPVCVGFGISSPDQARAVGAFADGVIIGTACVQAIGESSNPVEAARNFARAFKFH